MTTATSRAARKVAIHRASMISMIEVLLRPEVGEPWASVSSEASTWSPWSTSLVLPSWLVIGPSFDSSDKVGSEMSDFGEDMTMLGVGVRMKAE